MSDDAYILADDGRTPIPVDIRAWADWLEKNRGRKRVAYDQTPAYTVSTVFLGLDHSWGGGPPILWETMIFGGPLDQEQDRYSTYEDAVKGHAEMLRRAKEASDGC